MVFVFVPRRKRKSDSVLSCFLDVLSIPDPIEKTRERDEILRVILMLFSLFSLSLLMERESYGYGSLTVIELVSFSFAFCLVRIRS